MARSYPWNNWFSRKFLAKWFAARTAPGRSASAFRPAVEALADRVVPTVTFTFDGDLLTVNSDAQSDNITIRSDAATGSVLVNNVNTGAFLSTMNRLVVNGNGGNDVISLAQLNTSFLDNRAEVFGGTGNDTITGSSNADTLAGQDDDDTLAGGGGDDLLDGGAGNDTLRGNDGNDTIIGGVGDDLVREVGNVDFVLTPSALNAESIGTDSLGGIERAELVGGVGANTLDASAFTGPVTLNGGIGNGDDTLIGGSAADVLIGGSGNDTYIGGLGADTAIETITSESPSVRLISSAIQVNGTTIDTLSSISRVELTATNGAAEFTIDTTTVTAAVTGNAGSSNTRLTVPIPANATLSDGFLDRTGATDVEFAGIADVVLNGSAANNNINASAFNAPSGNVGVEINGGDGDDTIQGGSGFDDLNGGNGNDLFLVSGGLDDIRGDAGSDTVRATITIDAQLLDNRINTLNDNTSGSFQSSLNSIERAEITGNDDDNSINASTFTGTTVLVGNGGNDILNGGSGPNTLNGGAGDDLLQGGAGFDFLLAGAGNDDLRPGAGSGFADGGADTDTLTFTKDADMDLSNTSLVVSTGENITLGSGTIEQITLTGGASANDIDASAFTGRVTLSGGNGNDILRGGTADDVLEGGLGNDQLFGNDGDDTLMEDRGNDQLNGGGGVDTLVSNFFFSNGTISKTVTLSNSSLVFTDTTGLTETNTHSGLNAIDLTVGGTAGHTVNASATSIPVTLTGGSGPDLLIGGSNADVIFGGAGEDELEGRGGADQLFGGDGNDELYGFTQSDATDGANDTLRGEGGDDLLLALDPGDDNDEGAGTGGILVLGTAGDDVIVVRRQVTTDGPFAVVTINGVTTSTLYRNGETIEVRAGAGNDLVIMDESTAITWSGKLFGEGGDDVLMGASRPDYMDGGTGNDALFGNGGDDQLFGGAGKDSLYGGAGADILDGGDGNDHLDGGAGTDLLFGRGGNDSYAAADGEIDYLFVDSKDKKKEHDSFDYVVEL